MISNNQYQAVTILVAAFFYKISFFFEANPAIIPIFFICPKKANKKGFSLLSGLENQHLKLHYLSNRKIL